MSWTRAAHRPAAQRAVVTGSLPRRVSHNARGAIRNAAYRLGSTRPAVDDEQPRGSQESARPQ